MIFKNRSKVLHYNKTHTHGERLCNQDNMRGNCTTVVENVTCKKCKRIMLNSRGVHGWEVNNYLALEEICPPDTEMAKALKRIGKRLG